MKINFKLFLISFFLLGLLFPMLSHAETVELPQVNMCGDEYYSFILTVRSENTRNQGVKDAFTLPYCQLYDIMALEDELDGVRDEFRTAAFDCADTSIYEEKYHEILMEQYFVRNVQKSKSDVISSKDAEEFDDMKDKLLERLKEEMTAIFVTEEARISAPTFDTYFTNWSAQYDDRIGDYNQCDEGPWAELTGTWQDFIETLSELKIEVKEPEIKAPEFNADADSDIDMGATGKSVLNTWEYVKNLGNKNKVAIEEPPTVEDLSQSDEVFSYGGILALLNMDEVLYSIENNAADRMSRYSLLYGSGGAVAATDMQSILVQLNLVLQQSNTKDFPNIIEKAAKVYDKQCN